MRGAREARGIQRLESAALALALLPSVTSCTRHLELTSPDTDPGARYVCTAAEGCRPALDDVPAEGNPSNVVAVSLPAECAGHVHQILIRSAGSERPVVEVTCAPAEEPVGSMEGSDASGAP